MKRRDFIKSAGTGAALVGSASVAPAVIGATKKTPIKWRIQTYADTTLAQHVIKPQIEAFNQAANGEMEIDLFTSAELVADQELFRAVQRGTIEAAQTDDKSAGSPADVAIFSGYFPLATRFGLDVPALWDDQGLNEIWEEAYGEIDGVEWLGTGGWDPCNLATKKPIRKFSDLRGQKLYTTGTLAQFLGTLGVVPVTIANEDVAMGLQTGRLDGVAWSGMTELYTIGWADALKYVLSNPLSGGWAGSYFVNSEAWNKLPPHLQELFRLSIKKSHYHRLHWYWAGEAHYRANGDKLKITSMPADEWSKVEEAAAKFWDKAGSQSDRNARVVKILKEYQSTRSNAGVPYSCS